MNTKIEVNINPFYRKLYKFRNNDSTKCDLPTLITGSRGPETRREENILCVVYIGKDSGAIFIVDMRCGKDMRISNKIVPELLVVAKDHPGSTS